MRNRAIAPLAALGLLLALLTAGSSAQGAGEPGVVHFTAAGDLGASTRPLRRPDSIRT